MSAGRTAERGMALALAVFALVVVGALVVGAFLAGHLEQRMGRGTLYGAQAADAAEAGVSVTLAAWDAPVLNVLAPGAVAALPAVALGGRSGYRPTVTRLNDQLFLIQSLGTRANASGGVIARRTVAMVARLVSLGGGPEAALTTGRPIETSGGQVSIVGADSGAGSGAACAPARPQPAERTVPAAASAYTVFGDVTFDRLASHAAVVLPDTTLLAPVAPSLAAAPRRCDTSDPLNWGEPRRSAGTAVVSCRSYFPILVARGSRLEIAGGGRGQGVLLVEGDLDISGDFDFSGLIVVKGSLRTRGGRVRLTGAVMAANGPPDSRTQLTGPTSIRYSSCALREALAGAAFAEPLGQRSWVQVY